jgi:hypothetical protein
MPQLVSAGANDGETCRFEHHPAAPLTLSTTHTSLQGSEEALTGKQHKTVKLKLSISLGGLGSR